jgi:hypothetical protein
MIITADLNMLKLIWTDELGLWKTFWLLGVGGVLFAAIPIFAVMLALTDVPDDDTASWFLAAQAFLFAYQLLVSVGIWRSANLYSGDRQWAILAKICVVTGASVVVLLIHGVISPDVY